MIREEGIPLTVHGYECYDCGKRVVVYKSEQLSLPPKGWGNPYSTWTVCDTCMPKWEGAEASAFVHFAVIEVPHAS